MKGLYGYEIVEPPGPVVGLPPSDYPASTLLPPPEAAVTEPPCQSCQSCGRARRWHPDFIHSPAVRMLSSDEVLRLWKEHPQLCAECVMSGAPKPELKVTRRIRFGPKKSA